LSNNRL